VPSYRTEPEDTSFLTVTTGACPGGTTETPFRATTRTAWPQGAFCYECGAFIDSGGGEGTPSSPTVLVFDLDGEDVTVTLSDEYSTEDLIARVEALLPDWETLPWNVGASMTPALRFLEDFPGEEEMGYAVHQSRFKFRVPPNAVAAGCLKITWNETKTPYTHAEGGGDPVVTPREWSWDGVVPEGYDSGDPDTWPESEEFELSVAEGNFEITLDDFTVSCDCT
jgi:hypothetical protein